MKNIKHYIQTPNKSDWIIITIYWILSLVFLIPAYFTTETFATALTALLYNIVIDTTFVLILIYIILPFSLKNKNVWMPVLSVIFLLFFSMIFYQFGYGLILNKPQDWSFINIIAGVIHQAQSLGILLSILAMKRFYASQQNIVSLEKANAENILKVLSNQIAPHFLFNNLNVLQSLIDIDAVQAKEFVKHLSSIYRYLIRHKDEEVVTLEEEMIFAEDYIYLLNQRFGNAYVFKTEIADQNALKKLVPSCCLQVLLENIIKHNQGNEQNPLITSIVISENTIEIKNKIQEKMYQNDASGTGLENLNERYLLLSNQSITIHKKENFTVILPLINQLKSFKL
ncbi:histidine kinase [Flavobacterium sp. MC2016-06]|jgi:two-component system LytT family sensor kinase|uniref:sensor histidine kinase n=1 Tax=Flavobacterium sp. MC2016-06 TaxID=2676308 RepID=UPI0012BA6D7B|nr:histidine kinase [Flavobacterium sp. MC2016-06]MBU3860695.1 histidine kinase [Flavobacterium sp. MC2016-06]